MNNKSSTLFFCGLWLVLVASALFARPLLPVDETRYLAVAWEMYFNGDYIVPSLNGEAYSHKPPLLFWLMNLGWHLFGVSNWWAQLVAPSFGLVCLFLTRNIARYLWPEDHTAIALAPVILIGAAFWTVFTTLTMFDMLVGACSLFGILGLLKVWRTQNNWGWVYLSVAIGVGVLAKGPVILLQILPIALMVVFWDKEKRLISKAKWYGFVLLSIIAGAVIALSWAIPAGINGGQAYRDAIFWGQTAGRVVKSFDHAKPFWWYIAFLGPLLLPWFLWAPFWRSLIKGRRNLWADQGIRFCLLWFIPIFIAFSLISGKQFHYLLPIFPALALILARFLSQYQQPFKKWENALALSVVAILSFALFVLPLIKPEKLPSWVGEQNGVAMILVFATFLYAVFKVHRTSFQVVSALSLTMVSFVVALYICVTPYLKTHFDLQAMADQLKVYQDQGYEVGFVGKYHGTFQFMGRMTQPIHELETSRDNRLDDWLVRHPHSKVITIWREEAPDHQAVDYDQPFRNRHFIVFDVEKLDGNFQFLHRSGLVE